MKIWKRICATITACTACVMGVPQVPMILPETTAVVAAAEAGVTGEYGDFIYVVLDDGTIAITDCDVTATEAEIPAEIDGMEVTSIETRAFTNCDALVSVTVPDSITDIQREAFSGCESLISISVAGNNSHYVDSDGVLFSKNQTTLLCYPAGRGALQYDIPSSVTKIEMGAFMDCRAISSVTIPDSVTYIGCDVFVGCRSLTDVTIPDSVTYMGCYVFSGCTALTSVVIPEGVSSIETSIGKSVFYGCTALTSVTIPRSVESIGEYAFLYCTSLTDVYYGGTQEEWSAVIVKEGNESLADAAFHYADSPTLGINVAVHTPEEIRVYMDEHPFDMEEPTYDVTPSTTAPYAAGQLNAASLQNALNALNVMRYVAGLDAVTLNADYNDYAQACSLINAVNGDLSHAPEQPSDMSDDLYQLGAMGACSSNLGMGYINPAHAVVYGYMSDRDAYNISSVGHRRWCLNPCMESTGFGFVKNYTAMYAFDSNGGEESVHGVCWPAQNMPIEYFGSAVPWSISMGYEIDPSKVKVTLTRKSDSKTWVFSESASDGDFYVNNGNYGQKGCIIFRPSDISEYVEGDIFTVQIAGLNEDVFYTVHFFEWTGSTEQEDLLTGDLDGDNNITMDDAFAALTAYSKKAAGNDPGLTPAQLAAADIDGDGEVSMDDAFTILQYYSYHAAGRNITWNDLC